MVYLSQTSTLGHFVTEQSKVEKLAALKNDSVAIVVASNKHGEAKELYIDLTELKHSNLTIDHISAILSGDSPDNQSQLLSQLTQFNVINIQAL